MKVMKRIIFAGLIALLPIPIFAQQTTLDECIDMALRHNAKVKNARLETQVADEEKETAYTKLFPQINATAVGFIGSEDIIRSEMEIPMMGTLPLSMMKKGAMAMLTALQPLYMGGQILNGNKLAEVQREVRRLELAMTEKEVAQHVKESYWQLVALRGEIATLDAVDKQLAEVHSLTRQYVDAGVITRNDLLRVELKQQEMQSRRLALNNGIEAVRLMLAQLCGADMQTFDIAAQHITEPAAPETYFVQPDVALGNREEVQLTEKAVSAKALQVKMERGKNLPMVAVGAAGMYYNMMEKNQGNLIGLATVSVPISNWWGGTHDIRRAKVALEQSRNTRQDTQEKLRIDILTSWNALQEAYAQIEVARRSVSQADENLRLSRNQFDAGTQDMTELLDAVTLYTQSHSTLTTACARYQSRLAEYQRKVQ